MSVDWIGKETIMKKEILMPDYYPEFHCLASNCKYDCCHEWRIDLTKQDYTRIKNVRKSQELQTIVNKYFKRNRNKDAVSYAEILYKDDGVCSMYTEDGLCRLQMECGYTVLPVVCKVFPRSEIQTPSGLVEHSCSTGCEKVVMLLMERLDGIRFVQQVDDVLPSYIPKNFSKAIQLKPILNDFQGIRKLCIQILQNRSYSLENRMILLGLALQDLDGISKAYSPEKMKNWFDTKRLFLQHSDQLQDSLDRITVDPGNSLVSAVQHCKIFQGLFKKKRDLIEQVFQNLNIKIEEDDIVEFNQACFQSQKEAMLQNFPDFELVFENIIVNLFFEYQFPFGRESIWEQYKLFCFYYSFFYFMAVGYLSQNNTKDDFIYLFTVCSRNILHGIATVKKFVLTEFESNNVNSLADMITLIKF